MVSVSAFRWVPPFAQGLVRDLRVRWALEEAGIPYEIKLINSEDQKSLRYRALQPFGQVPVLEDEGMSLFESGAIALYIAEKSASLWPIDNKDRNRARTWVFAALNSLEPFMQNLVAIDIFNSDKEWARLRRPEAVADLKVRLKNLTDWMQGREYLERRFTVGDLMMTTVLRIPRHTNILTEFPILNAYKLRCEDRPAFKRALAGQMKVFAENAPPAISAVSNNLG